MKFSDQVCAVSRVLDPNYFRCKTQSFLSQSIKIIPPNNYNVQYTHLDQNVCF